MINQKSQKINTFICTVKQLGIGEMIPKWGTKTATQILITLIDINYYIYQGISQNMSFSLLPFDHDQFLNGLPALSMVNNTLLLIQTIKNMPNHSLTSLDAHEPEQIAEEEDSLGAQLAVQKKLALQTPDVKRKKTGCTCRKTNCLKNYCQCFSLGKECTPECACYGCFNNHDHSELVKQTKAEIKCKSSRKTSPGCICKKSQCQKKYCQCFNAGVACTEACKCVDCQNHVPHSHSSQDSCADMKNKRTKCSSRVNSSLGRQSQPNQDPSQEESPIQLNL